MPGTSAEYEHIGYWCELDVGSDFCVLSAVPLFCFLLESKKRAWLAFICAVIYNFVCSTYFFDESHIADRVAVILVRGQTFCIVQYILSQAV